jgi:hypothetical protein
MDASSVKWWVRHFKDGNISIQDQPRSSRPQTASTEPNKDATATKFGKGAQCSSGDYWKHRLLENLCLLGTAFTYLRP